MSNRKLIPILIYGEEDPDERLKMIKGILAEACMRADESLKRLDRLVPGAEEAFSKGFGWVGDSWQMHKMRAQGQSAAKHGDHTAAKSRYQIALAMIGDGLFAARHHSEILSI